jgi:Uma2 family endonuclease
MATDTTRPAVEVPPLRHGDRMTRAEFERRWEAMPDLKKAELIEGVVYIRDEPGVDERRRPPENGGPTGGVVDMSPVSRKHGTPHFRLVTWLGLYQLLTPGTEGGDNTSIRFDDDNMPQPDAILRIDENLGGRSRVDADGYYVGGPELVAEVARSSELYDLGVKRDVCRRHGVQEYIVWRVDDRAVDWFVIRNGLYFPLDPGPDGVLRSEVFPGLWLDPAALVAGDATRLLAVAQQGHGSPEHAAFVAELRRRAAGGA